MQVGNLDRLRDCEYKMINEKSLEVDKPTRDIWYRIATLMGHEIDVYPAAGDRWHVSVYFEDSVVIHSNHMVNEDHAHRAALTALPDYLHDLNTALFLYNDLPIHNYVDSRIRPGLHTTYAVVIKRRRPEHDVTDEDEVVASWLSDVSLADAYCRAWLQWKSAIAG
jgi:hypothetical protein